MDMLETMNIVESVYEKMKELPFAWYQSAICMLLEMKCKDEGEDMVETTKNIADIAKQVNAELGKF